MNFIKLSKIALFISIFGVFVTTIPVYAQFNFSRPLKIGDRGNDVLELQKVLNSDPETLVSLSGPGSPGKETEFFGNLTKKAVISFQNKYKSEILTPIGLYQGTGFVGGMTLKRLNRVSVVEKAPAEQIISREEVVLVETKEKNPIIQTEEKPSPVIRSVFPNRVKKGDIVTITGENFSVSNNSVELLDGPITKRFDNLSSKDGKELSFVFEPPTIVTMSEKEIRNLPENIVEQIEGPLREAGKTLSDALSPYKNFKTEEELAASLEENGHSFDEMYNYYFISLETSDGRKVISETPMIYGLRDLSIGEKNDEEKSDVLTLTPSMTALKNFVAWLLPTANAQAAQFGGGLNSGIIMICTCGDGYLTFMTDYGGKGTGLYQFSWGFLANVGAGYITPNWLGGYIPNAGSCSIYAGYSCINISANRPARPWGTNLLF